MQNLDTIYMQNTDTEYTCKIYVQKTYGINIQNIHTAYAHSMYIHNTHTEYTYRMHIRNLDTKPGQLLGSAAEVIWTVANAAACIVATAASF